MNCRLYIEIIEAIYLCENELMTELLVFDSKTCKHLIVCKKRLRANRIIRVRNAGNYLTVCKKKHEKFF